MREPRELQVVLGRGQQEAMKILIVGNGQIGSALVKDLSKDNEVTVWSGDMGRLTAGDVQGDAVICAAGKTDLKWCEENPREAFEHNVEKPLSLSRACRKAGAFYLHFSSGCVWDGPFNDGKPFNWFDPPTPASFYAWTKAACDALLCDRGMGSIAILRPRQVFSAIKSPRNTLEKLRAYPALIDTPNSMTSLDAILTVTRYVLERRSTGRVWNVCNPGIITPYQVGVMLAEAGLRAMPEKLPKSDLDGWHKPRRVDTVLNDADMVALGIPAVEDAWRTTIAKVVAQGVMAK